MSELDRMVILSVLAKVARELRGELTNRVVERMSRFRDDPVGFAREIMGLSPWSRQCEILEAVAKHDNVLVRSGHKVGKSMSAIILALWFVATRARARVLLTAPTAAQIKVILWRELSLQYPRVATILEGPPELPKDPATGIAFSGDREIFGRTSRTKEGAAGVSGAEMLFIVDEASGFSDEQYEVVIGNAASRVKVVGFSNPTRAAGWFFEGFRNGLWHTIHVSSEESPNVVAALERRARGEEDRNADDEIEGLARLPWVEKYRAECGANYRTHPIYQVRVEGNFPSSGPNAIFSLDGVERARKRWDEHVARNRAAGKRIDEGIWGPLELGIDPSRYGDDDAVVFPRRSRFFYEPAVLSGKVSGAEIADAAVQLVRRWRHPRMDGGPVVIKVDAIGVGVETIGALRAHEAMRGGEIVVIAIDVNEASDDPEKYSDLRTQLWFAGAEFIGAPEVDEDGDELAGDEDGEAAMIPPVPKLTQELLAASYKFDARGRFLAASKDELREVLTPKRSPDHADAFNLAVYRAPAGRLEVMTERDLERRRRGREPQRGSY